MKEKSIEEERYIAIEGEPEIKRPHKPNKEDIVMKEGEKVNE